VRRITLYAVTAFVIVVAAAFFVHYRLTTGDPGYVIIGYDRWSLESSLVFVVTALLITFIVFYAVVRMLARAVRLPKVLKRRGGELRSRRSREALIEGLIESAEGNYEKAEKALIRHAADSGTPLIHYLTAARAAQSRGAYEERDEYLKRAHETMPEAEIAIGLTRAELQLSNKQFAQALESLTQLNKIAPSHAAVLKLMHQAYGQIEDWEAVRTLIPALHTNKVMMEAEIKLLETETYSNLLKQASAKRDAAALRELWETVPDHIRASTGVLSLYFAAMIEAGAGAEIEAPLRRAIDKEWDETLLILYGCIQLPDTAKQLQYLEKWLTSRPRDAVLLRVLGKLAVRAQRWDKASSYLQRSLEAEPSVEAYQLMGDMLSQQNDWAGACDCYRKGLMFASSEVVAQIELNPADQLAEARG
jgi:HemY protein